MKAIGGFLRFLFLLILLALVGYNTYEIAQLRAELDQLHSPTHHTTAIANKTTPLSRSSSVSKTAEPDDRNPRQRHWEDAGKEAAEAIDALKKANSDAQAASQRTVSDLQKRIADLSARVESLKPPGGISLPHQNTGAKPQSE